MAVTVHVSLLVESDILAFERVNQSRSLSHLDHFLDAALNHCAFDRGHIKQETEEICEFFLRVQHQILVTKEQRRYLFRYCVHHELVVQSHQLGAYFDELCPPAWVALIELFVRLETVALQKFQVRVGRKHIEGVSNDAEHLVGLEGSFSRSMADWVVCLGDPDSFVIADMILAEQAHHCLGKSCLNLDIATSIDSCDLLQVPSQASTATSDERLEAHHITI